MLAAQLLGTTTVALLMLMAVAMAMPRLLDIALVFAILAAIAVGRWPTPPASRRAVCWAI